MNALVQRSTAIAAAMLAAAAALLVPASPATASTSSEALFFASPHSNKVVVRAAGKQTTVTAFPVAQLLAGHFTSNAGAQAFLYNPGGGRDGLLDVVRSGDGVATTLTEMPVGGTFKPVVADLDLDGHDDIFWYAPGTARDYAWFFEGDGTFTSVPMSVDLVATPYPVLVDGIGDKPARQTILFYGKGSLADSIWTFTGRSPSARRVSIAGSYRIVVGSFFRMNYGQSHQQVLFYDPAGGRNSVWTFHRGDGAHRADALSKTPGKGYVPFITRAGLHGGDFIYWYGPGAIPEKFWTVFGPSDIQDASGCCEIKGSYRTIRDPQGRSADEEIVFLTEGTEARTLQLAPEHYPVLSTITTITGLPKAPRGAVTWFEQPVP